MNTQINFYQIAHWISRFMQVQLFITLISLPILIAWGLPISALSPIGNLFFSPVLSVFLLLSSIIFFCELLGVPSKPFVFLLEWVSFIWIWVMQWANNTVLIGCAKLPWPFLLSIPIATGAILLCKQTSSLYKSIGCFLGLFVVIFTASYFAGLTSTYFKIPCNKGSVHVIQKNGMLIVVDPGYIAQKPSAQSWVQFTLLPEITKQTGKTSIDHFVVLQPSSRLFEALHTLCSITTIANLYLPTWEGTLTKAAWRNFFVLQKACKNKNITITRIHNKKIAIAVSSTDYLTIEPLSTYIPYQSALYRAMCVRGLIDKDIVTFYSAKYHIDRTRKGKL